MNDRRPNSLGENSSSNRLNPHEEGEVKTIKYSISMIMTLGFVLWWSSVPNCGSDIRGLLKTAIWLKLGIMIPMKLTMLVLHVAKVISTNVANLVSMFVYIGFLCKYFY